MIPRPLRLALPSNISNGVASPASSATMVAPIGAEVELQDTAVPIGTDVLLAFRRTASRRGSSSEATRFSRFSCLPTTGSPLTPDSDCVAGYRGTYAERALDSRRDVLEPSVATSRAFQKSALSFDYCLTSCLSLPLRSAKRLLPVHIHRSAVPAL